MGGKRWSKTEKEALIEFSGTYTIATIARKIGRSFDATNIMAKRLGVGGFLVNTDRLTLHQLSIMFGADYKTITNKWYKHGLKHCKKGNFIVFDQQHVIQFLKNNQDLWNATNVTEDAMLMRFSWYQEKKKRDSKKQYFWESWQVERIKMRYREGKPLKDVSIEVGKTEQAVRNKLYALRKQGFKI